MTTDGKPKKRGDCIGGLRPCPWISCKHHMIWFYKDFLKDKDATIVKRLLAMRYSCTLDLADLAGLLYSEIGRVVGVSRERVRQMVDCDTYDKTGVLQKLRKKKHYFDGYL